MNYMEGVEREQILLFPGSVDEYIADSNPARFIEAFVDQLDLSNLEFKSAELQATGRPPYHPGKIEEIEGHPT